MNQKRTFNLFNPKGIGRQIPKLALSLAALALLALTACAPVGGFVAVPAAPVEGVVSTAVSGDAATAHWVFMSTNPEVMLTRGYVPPGGWTRRMPQHLTRQNKVDPDSDIGLLEFSKPQTTQAVNTPNSLRKKVDPDSDIGLLEFFKPPTTGDASTFDQHSFSVVLNPELSAARRYTAAPLVTALAANPELSTARHYVPYAIDDQSSLAVNPELTVARRYSPGAQADAARLAANPELSTARHYISSSLDSQAALDSFLAANPEVMLAHAYVPPRGWTRRMPQHLKLQNKIDPDRDIGLLEFSKPQTAKDASPADPLSDSLALNPELSVARRHAAPLEAKDASAFVSLPLRRWPCLGQRTPRSEVRPESYLLALNPELSVARRYATPSEAGDAPDTVSLPLRRWSCLGQRAD
jgi:hypothetical protein